MIDLSLGARFVAGTLPTIVTAMPGFAVSSGLHSLICWFLAF
jgi:hypothetical protein